MNTERAFILLATHNGERFLREQIESIQAQTHTDWELFAYDDRSGDGTPDLLASLAAAERRITRLPSAGDSLGAAGSFARLVEHAFEAGARYAFFCDQDDVWLPHKIETELEMLLAAERKANDSTPLLVHSDLRVVDAGLKPIHGSYREFNGVSYDRADPLATLVLHNAVVGCTAAFNRPAMQRALPFPPAVYHDWWMAQCAAAAGSVIDCGAPTVLYRQHGENLIGARGRHAFVPTALRHPRAFIASAFADFDFGVRQAFALERRISERPAEFSGAARARLQNYCDAFRGHGVTRRLRELKRSGVRPQRLISYPFLYGLTAIYPHVRRA